MSGIHISAAAAIAAILGLAGQTAIAAPALTDGFSAGVTPWLHLAQAQPPDQDDQDDQGQGDDNPGDDDNNEGGGDADDSGGK